MSDEELRSLIEDARKYLREDTEDLESNQQAIGMKHLFRGVSIKAWNELDFGDNKHIAYNKKVNQHCINYNYKYWEDRNENFMIYSKKKSDRMAKKEQLKALEGQHQQVRKCAKEKKIDTKMCRNCTHLTIDTCVEANLNKIRKV